MAPTRREVLNKAGTAAAAATVVSVASSVAVVGGCTKMKSLFSRSSSVSRSGFAPGFSGKLTLPGDADYPAARTIINPRIDVSPAAIAYCRSAADVSAVVKWARANSHSVAVRSGGHSYEGYCLSQDLVIDVSQINNIDLSADQESATVGAGCQQGAIATELWKSGRTLVMGSCKSVGISGFALGGGFGFLSRKHGMAVDNILAIEVVDASGNVLQCRSDLNHDLFWALRGGGCGNFGIVTQLTFKTHVVDQATLFGFEWPLESADEIVPLWFDWIQSLPNEAVSIMSMNGGNVADSEKTVRVMGQMLGTVSDFNSTMNLPRWSAPQWQKLEQRNFIRAVDYFGGDGSPERRWRARSDYFTKPLDAAGIAAIQKNLNLPGRPFAVSCLFDSYGPVINSVPVSDTAFAHRGNILCCMQTYLSWDGENQDDNSKVWMTRFGGDLAASGNVSGQAYPNYIDSTRDDWQTAYYGANLDQLKAIKKKYDPDNWFSFPQSIPLA